MMYFIEGARPIPSSYTRSKYWADSKTSRSSGLDFADALVCPQDEEYNRRVRGNLVGWLVEGMCH